MNSLKEILDKKIRSKSLKIILFVMFVLGLSSCTTRQYSPNCVEWYTPVGTAGLSSLSNLAVADPQLKPVVARILANEFKYTELSD